MHFTVRDGNRKIIFESGALNPDGSIQGNDNDADPARFEPHYSQISRGDQVEIYESIMRDQAGHVTTGLLNAVGYLKDNRLLPHGFDKETADKDIAVYGEAAGDSGFTDRGSQVRYWYRSKTRKALTRSPLSCGINRSATAGQTT